MNFKNLKLGLGLCVLSLQLTTSFTPALAFEGGGMDGGGGGGYKLPDGKIVTLPEFGILIEEKYDPIETTGKRYSKYYNPSESVVKEILRIKADINKKFPGFTLHNTVIPEKSTLVLKDDVDPSEYLKIKNEYKLVLAAFGYQLDEEKFVLPAVSLGTKTYILPDFHLLNDHQKAKYLIHEAGMRADDKYVDDVRKARILRLEKQLKLDVLIEKVLKSKGAKDLDPFKVVKTLVELEIYQKDQVAEYLLGMMADEAGGVIEFDQLSERYPEGMITLDPGLVQEFQELKGLKRNYSEIFDGAVFNLWKEQASVFKETINQTCKKYSDFSGKWIIAPVGSYFPDLSQKGAYIKLDERVAILKCTKSSGFLPKYEMQVYRLMLNKPSPFIQKFY